jgi:hypothetical protein
MRGYSEGVLSERKSESEHVYMHIEVVPMLHTREDALPPGPDIVSSGEDHVVQTPKLREHDTHIR